ncbi:hypothetical protein A3L11_08525 [Thermococcus siculi]|uniref:CRISPR-associated protein n=1 Tax=Thermococcus siculi TaxID=72803 RepID=A0A2Z2MZ17_9EURY|nr:hypothetical protein [Thermococcus siculi]ASJ09270.1 hypothetical protein A3L11_08525 [Thermococcus siculi]
MRAYVTAVGTSPEAVFNPLWYLAEARSWMPDEVYLFWNEGVKRELERVRELIGSLAEAYGVDVKVRADESLKFDESRPEEFREKVFSLLSRLRGGEVVVDITPGRKFMSATLFGAAVSTGAGVTYLHLSDWRDYMGRLLFEVPMAKQRLFTGEELLGRREAGIGGGRREKESPGSFTVTRRNLMAVLDSLYLDGIESFEVSLRGRPIGEVNLGEEARFSLRPYLEVPRENGGHTMVKEAIISGGMASFRNWEELRDTLYTLAVTLGELNFAHYRIYGIWHGKDSEDWEGERVKLEGFEYGRILKVLPG